MRRRVVVLGVAFLVVAVGVAGVVAWRLLHRPTEYERAVGYLPASTLRASWTDWEAVRSEAGGAGLSAGSSAREVQAFLDRAYDKDLTSTSALVDTTYAMQRHFGFSPLDAAWEVLGQAPEGQVVVLSMKDGVDLEGIEQRLRRLGYDEPAGGLGSGGTWQGSADLVAGLDSSLTPVVQNVAVLPSEHLVVFSDAPDPVSTTASVVAGDRSGLDVGELASAAGTPVTATLWASDFACQDLSMGEADEEDQRVGESLLRKAGQVSPLSGLVMAQQPDRSIRVGMLFENDDQAAENLQARVDLAAGEAPGQGGSFRDRFTVTSGKASGRTVVLALKPTKASFVFSDISTGPVLFATC